MTEKEMKIFKFFHDRKLFILNLQSELEDFNLNDIIKHWQKEKNTLYQKTIEELLQSNIIPLTFANQKEPFAVGGFRYIRHQAMVDYIKAKNDWSNDKKYEIATCYIDLVKWLNDISFGWFKISNVSYQISPHAMKKTLSFQDWRSFIEILYKRNQRDELIARTLLQGQKRISEVLNLTLSQIYFKKNTIHYKSKRGNEEVQYEKSFMKELKEYINETTELRKGEKFVFITRTGKPVTRLRLNYSFAKVCNLKNIKKISPENLRGIYKIFIQQRYKETAIMQSYKDRIEKSKIRIKKEKEDCNNEISKK